MCRIGGAEVAYQVLSPGVVMNALAKEQNGLPHIEKINIDHLAGFELCTDVYML